MILVALGANLPTQAYGPPEQALRAALMALEGDGIRPLRCSRLYRSAPVPPSGQPWYVNAIAEVASELAPQPLMAALLRIEARFGRKRSMPNAARTLDLDLVDHDGKVGTWAAGKDLPALTLPHPRLAERAFVLVPLAELAPDWRHPATSASISALIAALPPDQAIEPLPQDANNA